MYRTSVRTYQAVAGTVVAVRDTTFQGDVTETQVAAALVRRGMRILRPLSSAARYDLLIDDDDGHFTRIQCKTGILRHGCVVFRLYSVSGHDTANRPYVGQADAFGVYCPQTNRSYLVPLAAISSCRFFASLRVEPARNGQRVRTRAAEEFAIS